jgi:hypothetical protein
MLGWSPKDISSTPTATITANMSAQQVGISFPFTAGGAVNGCLVAMKCSGIAGTVTLQLEHGVAGEYSSVSGKTATLANGWNYIKLHHNVAGDAALMPLLDTGRLTITSNGSGAGTILKFFIFQEM